MRISKYLKDWIHRDTQANIPWSSSYTLDELKTFFKYAVYNHKDEAAKELMQYIITIDRSCLETIVAHGSAHFLRYVEGILPIPREYISHAVRSGNIENFDYLVATFHNVNILQYLEEAAVCHQVNFVQHLLQNYCHAPPHSFAHLYDCLAPLILHRIKSPYNYWFDLVLWGTFDPSSDFFALQATLTSKYKDVCKTTFDSMWKDRQAFVPDAVVNIICSYI